MLLSFIGVQGTFPNIRSTTIGLLVDNKILLDIPPEFVMVLQQLQQRWSQSIKTRNLPPSALHLKTPSVSTLDYLILSHFHYDHWGGLKQLLRLAILLFKEWRQKHPFQLYIPLGSMYFFKRNLVRNFLVPKLEALLNTMDEAEFFKKFLTIELETSLAELIEVHVFKDGDVLSLENGKYLIECYQTSHLPFGSYAFRVIKQETRLNHELLAKLGLKPGPWLGELRRKGKVTLENQELTKDQVYLTQQLVLAYSSDTALDPALLSKLLKPPVHVLIHDCTYFIGRDKRYLQSHTALTKLLPTLLSHPLANDLVFIPIHYSKSIDVSEIQETIATLAKLWKETRRLEVVNLEAFLQYFKTLQVLDEKTISELLESSPSFAPSVQNEQLSPVDPDSVLFPPYSRGFSATLRAGGTSSDSRLFLVFSLPLELLIIQHEKQALATVTFYVFP